MSEPGDLPDGDLPEGTVLPLEETSTLDEPARSPLKFVLRIVIGFVVVGVLIWRTPDRDKLLDALSNADIGWLVAGAAALFVGMIASAARWSAYLDALEIPMRFGTVVRLYFVGTFFNAFLPSGVGGDAYKAVRIGKAHGRYTPGLASVFLDRFAGFVALAVIGLFGALAELLAAEPVSVAKVSAILSGGMLTAALLLLIAGERLLGPRSLIKESGVGGKMRGAVRAIHAAGRHRESAARGYLFGLLFQILVLTYHLCVLRAIGISSVSAAGMTGVVVVASLATIIPLSPGGLGFREYAYVWSLGTFAVARHDAVAFALLILAILLATSLAGGIVYVIAGGEVKGIRRHEP